MLLKRPHIGNLTVYLKVLEKGQTKPRAHRRRKKLVNDVEIAKQQCQWNQNWVYKNLNKSDRAFARLTRKKWKPKLLDSEMKKGCYYQHYRNKKDLKEHYR